MKQLLVVILLFLALDCQQGPPRQPIDGDPSAARPTTASPALLGMLENASALHHRADDLLARGDVDAALAELTKVIALPAPADGSGSEELDDVHTDARARAALVLLGAGRLTEAAQLAEAGLGERQRDSFVRANLWSVRGQIHEALARTLADPSTELRAALAAYDRGREMNERIQIRLAAQKAKEAKP